MANKVLIKRSSVASKNPATTDLSLGELALNTYDGNLFFKKSPNGNDAIVTVVTLDGTQTLTNKTLTTPTIGTIYAPSGSNLVLSANGYTWTHGTNGNLTFPDGSVQPTAYTGPFSKVIANTTATANCGYLANTGAGAFTITLPASPLTGQFVVIADDNNFGTTPLYVGRNGNPIAGQPQDLTIDIAGASVTLMYDGGSWNVYSQIGATGGSGSGGTQYNFSSFPQGLIPDTNNTYALGNTTYKWSAVNAYTYRFGDNTTQTTASNADSSSITNSGGTITAQAGGLAGNTLNSGVVYSSLQTLGTQTQRINWQGSGVAAPQFTSSSVGTKLLLYPAISSGSADYAIGIESGTIWYGLPNASSGYFFKWYGGTTNLMQLEGSGALTITTPTLLTTSTGTASVFNTNATTLNMGGAATTVSIGSSSGTTTVNNNLVVTGTFTVNGATETINATTIQVADKNIELGKVATPTDTTADGGGITLKGATDKTIIWDSANNNWTSSENWNIATGKSFKINNVSVLNSTTLGSGVTGSSLTSVGTITSGTWSGSFGAVSGANLTSLTAGNLTGTIPSTVLGNSTVYIGTTAVALNRASGNLALTGILSETYSGSTSGTIQLIPAAIAGTGTVITLPATTGTVVTTGDSGTVTNTMLAGSIATSKITGLATSATTDTTNATNITSGTLPNARLSSIPNTALANSSVTVGTTAIALGASSTTLAGLTSVSSTSFTGALTGNASTATTLATARAINGVNFDGSAAITVKASTTNALTISTGLSGTSFDGSSAVTIAIDSTVTTLTGTQTLTNKTLTTPTINGAALSGTLSGTPTFSGLVTLNYTGAGSTSTLNLAGYNSKGGTGYHDFLIATNGYGSATNPSKWFRINSTGALEIINNAYTASLFNLSDSGDLVIAGNLTQGGSRPAFRVYGGGTTAINATNTLTSSNWVVDYQQGSNLNGTTGVFTAPVAGLYQVGLVARWGGSASTSAIQVQKVSGGTTTTQLYLEWAGNSTSFHMGGSAIVKMATNDTLKLTVTAGTVTFDANDQWSVAFIG
jgi:hypothetical protein